MFPEKLFSLLKDQERLAEVYFATKHEFVHHETLLKQIRFF